MKTGQPPKPLTPWQRARSLASTTAAVALLFHSSTAAPAVRRAARALDAWLRPSVRLSWERGYRAALRLPSSVLRPPSP